MGAYSNSKDWGTSVQPNYHIQNWYRKSVCLSITRWYCVQTAKDIIELLASSGSPIILVVSELNGNAKFQWVPIHGAAAYRWGINKLPISTFNSPYLWNKGRQSHYYGTLIITHAIFRTVSFPMILSDLWRLFSPTGKLSGASILKKPAYIAQWTNYNNYWTVTPMSALPLLLLYSIQEIVEDHSRSHIFRYIIKWSETRIDRAVITTES